VLKNKDHRRRSTRVFRNNCSQKGSQSQQEFPQKLSAKNPQKFLQKSPQSTVVPILINHILFIFLSHTFPFWL